MQNDNVLYISIIGMTEPLGKSQVLEYVNDLSSRFSIFLYSFEKDIDKDTINNLSEQMRYKNIRWSFQKYSNKYGSFSTIKQIFTSYKELKLLIKSNNIQLIHARSLIPVIIALFLKRKFKLKVIFDIRAFQIDEKAEAGRLKQDSILYKFLKKIENYCYKKSDSIVTLTYASIPYISSFSPREKITVIPTCANNILFKVISDREKVRFKSSLGYSPEEKIVVHVGDVRDRYDFDFEIKLFNKAYALNQNLRFLIINRGAEHEFIKKKLNEYNIGIKSYKIISSSFYDIYKYLNISDVSLFLIRPSFARLAMSPTKFAENLACHLPSFTNKNVGDMGKIMQEYEVGVCVDLKEKDNSLEKWANSLVSLVNKKIPNEHYTLLFNKYFKKEIAVQKYSEIYSELLDK